MKKLLSLVLVFAMLFALAGCGNSSYVYISIATAGEVQMAAVKVSLKDADNDGVLTVNDALLLAHKKYAPGKLGDYSAEDGGYGLAITKLWGDDCGSYGYCVNNATVANLEAEIVSGDYIYAYSYKDLSSWSDVYTYFENTRLACDGSEVTVKLYQMTYDASWNAVVSPCEGVSILVNGLNVGETDAKGELSFSANISGGEGVVVKAASSEMVIVPAVCRLVKNK